MSDQPLESQRVGHLPGLDGLRGFALTIVLLYHHGVTWMTGGELTVSMFFTLSGFLITRLLVSEWSRSGTFSLKVFYERRMRRLFPASFVVLLGVVVIWTLLPGSGRRVGPWEWFSGLAYFENFYLQGSGKEYGNLFGLGNPLQHLWSLALEEQVYLFFPLLCFFLLRNKKTVGALWKLFAVLLGLALVSISLGWYYKTHAPLWSHLPGATSKCSLGSCTYYATEVRVGEFLMGAAFAVLWAAWRYVPKIMNILKGRSSVILSWPFLVGSYVIWYKIGFKNGWHDFFFPWGVFFNCFITFLYIAYASVQVGMCRLLAWKPLVWMGQVTYTVYLVHWPVFMFWESLRLQPNLPRLKIPGTNWIAVDNFWIFVGKFSTTMILVCLIYYLIENPVRQRKIWQGKKLFAWLAVLAVVGSGFAFAGQGRRSAINDVMSTLSPEALAMQQRALGDLPDLPFDAPSVSAVDAQLPARIMMVGDSQSWVLASGLDGWERENQVVIQPSPGVGCGIADNTPLIYLGREQKFRSGCTEWRAALTPIVTKFRPNLVIIVGGTADLSDRKIPGVEGWAHIGQPAYDQWLLQQFANFVDVMSATGSKIVWLTSANIDPPFAVGETGKPPFDEAQPARTQRYNELITQYGAADERVEVADFAAQVQAHPGGEFESKMRPDRTHIDLMYAPELVLWLDALIRNVYADG